MDATMALAGRHPAHLKFGLMYKICAVGPVLKHFCGRRANFVHEPKFEI